MPLLSCFVTPHPPIIIPEIGGDELSRVQSTVNAMQTLAGDIAALNPDTIVLMSPHAALARYQMSVCFASAYRGSFSYFRAPRVTVQAQADLDVAKAILEEASRHGIPTMVTGSNEKSLELDHGAMVPLYYLFSRLRTPSKLVLISFSYLSIDEHVRFGRAVGNALEDSASKVVYVASGDLSHRLTPDAPSGFDPRGEVFDRAVVEAFEKDDWEGLLSINSGIVDSAGECGYRSLAVLSGIVEAVGARGAKAHNRLLSYEGPFGVGYLVGRVDLEASTERSEP